MTFIQKLISNKKIVLLAAAFISAAVLLISPEFHSGLNKTTRNYLNKIFAYSADSGIVIIELNEEDINKLGWPLKRNYYALLINKLNSLGAKTIGLEIFLSPGLSHQSIYNDLIVDVINAKGNTVLGSIAENINGEDFQAEKIIFPAPKKIDKKIHSGHLNFEENGEIIIPLKVKSKNSTEPSFSSAIYSLFSGGGLSEGNLVLNPKHKWTDFNKSGMLEFLTSQTDEADKIRGKIVLIGVTALTLAKFVDAGFGDKIPGIAVHAFALENLIRENSLITNYSVFSAFAVFLVFVILIFLGKDEIIWIPFLLLFMLLSAVYLTFNFAPDFAFLIAPFFLIEISRKGFELFESKKAVAEFSKEKDILQKALRAKENELSKIQNQIDSNENAEGSSLKVKIEELKSEIDNLKQNQLDEESAEVSLDEISEFEGIIYKSRKMQAVIDLVKKVAPTDANILIYGESGSGKELIARALHNLSDRNPKQFIAINCAALTESLLESELFGYVKGAFTNALADKKGLFEAANDGTIFLDEIGEISPAFQAKLLRVLQNGEYHKVGSTVTSKTNARILAATNKDLQKLVEEKKFREDLYYRLNVISINLSPLRERKEEIELLSEYFLKKEAPELRCSKAVMSQLEKYDWRGNVRELESVIKRASIFAVSEKRNTVHLRDLPDELRKNIKDSLEEMILDSLRNKGFSHSSINETAAELGGLSRTIVSENLRGIFFRYYCENNFDHLEAVKNLAKSQDENVINKLAGKTETYLRNISKDVKKHEEKSFEQIKSLLNSKYKNLPQRYHRFLDEIIKHFAA